MPQKKAINVLIVEDDQLLAKALQSKLEQEDFLVTRSKDGEEAVQMAKSDPPDIILLDLLLPIMGGYEVLSSLRLEASTKNIPVLILSNLGQAEEIQRAESLGAQGYLVKSNVSLKTVVEKVRSILDASKK